jgi:ribonuclease P protein component
VTRSSAHPPAARLRTPADFTALRRDSKRLSTDCFQAQYRLVTGGQARLGMAVSRRISKLAVVRNRIRRIVRESFRAARAQLPGCDVLVIARSAAAQKDRPGLRAAADLIWQQLAALKPHDATRTIAAQS